MENATQLLEVITSNPWIIFISFLLTFVGFFLAIIFFIRGRKCKDPRYSIRSNSLIKNFTQQINGLSISYNNEPVSSITVSKIAFWNKGKETLNYSDFAESDPLEILSKSEILSATIIFSSNQTNVVSCEVSNDKKKVIINFDYFDKNDGFIIQMIHTGGVEDSLFLNGTVKGVGSIRKRKIYFEPFYVSFLEKLTNKKGKDKDKKKYLNISLKITGWLLVICCVFILIAFVYALMTKKMKKEDYAPAITMFLVYMLMGIELIRPKIPRGFREFYEIIE